MSKAENTTSKETCTGNNR